MGFKIMHIVGLKAIAYTDRMDQDQHNQEPNTNHQGYQQYRQPPVNPSAPQQQTSPGLPDDMSQTPSARGYNKLAIVGFILNFFVPIVGLVLCIIALNQIKRSGEKGRGLAKAGIIIFITVNAFIFVGILAALFLN